MSAILPAAAAIARIPALALIQAYRWLISPFLPSPCRFLPTCSAYGLEAIGRLGVVTGGWLTLKRICRCHPWGGSGFDPVPAPAASRCRRDGRTAADGVER
jgi:putative membrane protein insertion efficiency factor